MDAQRLSEGLRTVFEGVAMVFDSLGVEKTKFPQVSITQDELVKVIVKKIKENPANNVKIKQLLSSYSVSKLSELPEANYDAFMTGLEAL